MDTSPHSELMCGIAVGPSRLRNWNGTIGAIVTRNDAPMDRYIMSNHHVLVVDHDARTGDIIGQPAGGQDVARLDKENAVLDAFVDVALAKIINPRNASCKVHEIERINRIGRITGVAEGTKGTRVHKRGIGSGLTSGTIVDTDQIGRGSYKELRPEPWTLNGQFKIQADLSGTLFSKAGDSGACVVDDNLRVVGLLVGGSGNDSYATPIQTVINTLGITICP